MGVRNSEGPLQGPGFPCGSAGKESACNAGDLASIPGLGRFPGEGKGYPLQCSGLENSMDCIVHGVSKSQTQMSSFHFCRLLTSPICCPIKVHNILVFGILSICNYQWSHWHCGEKKNTVEGQAGLHGDWDPLQTCPVLLFGMLWSFLLTRVAFYGTDPTSLTSQDSYSWMASFDSYASYLPSLAVDSRFFLPLLTVAITVSAHSKSIPISMSAKW